MTTPTPTSGDALMAAKEPLRPLRSMTADELEDLLQVAGFDLKNINSPQGVGGQDEGKPSIHPKYWAHYDDAFDHIRLEVCIPPCGDPESEWDERPIHIEVGVVTNYMGFPEKTVDVVTWFMRHGFIATPSRPSPAVGEVSDDLDRMDYLVSDVHLNEFALRERIRELIAEMRSAIAPAQPVTVSEGMVRAAQEAAGFGISDAEMRAALAAAMGQADKQPVTVSEDDGPHVGPEWQRTRTAFAGLTDAIAHMMTGRRLDPSARQKFVDCSVAVDEMQAACEAYRDAMGKAITAAIGRGGDGWTQKLPTEQGRYWHWDGDEDNDPLPWWVMKSGTDGRCFTSLGQYGRTMAVDCEEMGGWWMSCPTPRLPDAPRGEG